MRMPLMSIGWAPGRFVLRLAEVNQTIARVHLPACHDCIWSLHDCIWSLHVALLVATLITAPCRPAPGYPTDPLPVPLPPFLPVPVQRPQDLLHAHSAMRHSPALHNQGATSRTAVP